MSLSFNGNAEFKPTLFSSACYLRGHWPEIKTSKAKIRHARLGKRREKRGERRRVKDRAKNGASKRAGRGGEERKEMLVDKPLDFENRPLGLSCLSSRNDI